MKKQLIILLAAAMILSLAACENVNINVSNSENEGLYATMHEETDSPEWVKELPSAQDEKVTQLFIVAGLGMDKTTATVSMHERDKDGNWKEIMSTPGYVGKNGLCPDEDHEEGCGQTPIGIYKFNKAFGIADDPGCAIPYVKVDDDTYWSGDPREGMHYNEMVDIKDYPDLLMDDSEHIVDYDYQYQYCMNISFNEDGTPGRGSAIFLHCLGPLKPYTGGCVAIPENQMKKVMKNVKEDCVVIIDTLENISPEYWEAWGLTSAPESSATYDPADFNISDVYEAPEQTPMDISGCDTFTKIVDKLDEGMGYANVGIGDTDVLLISEGTYEWDNDVYAAIDAQLFIYSKDEIIYLGTVMAGGTAYPLAVKDGYLYVGGNHFMTKYLVDEGTLIKVEEGYVTYDKDGNDIYYYETCNAVFEKYDEETAKNNFEELFKEQAGAEVINFQPVGE
ncbi:MAG: hypothetical protein IK111_11785 [Lachnospiraceae bacterium]|nr:hypothetical protein [Lachnospiraceae bacterium]